MRAPWGLAASRARAVRVHGALVAEGRLAFERRPPTIDTLVGGQLAPIAAFAAHPSEPHHEGHDSGDEERDSGGAVKAGGVRLHSREIPEHLELLVEACGQGRLVLDKSLPQAPSDERHQHGTEHDGCDQRNAGVLARHKKQAAPETHAADNQQTAANKHIARPQPHVLAGEVRRPKKIQCEQQRQDGAPSGGTWVPHPIVALQGVQGHLAHAHAGPQAYGQRIQAQATKEQTREVPLDVHAP
mmetsp:Transcript_53567/g.154463  ORF Transcript_53567/g.154463 Transcript_53567/m.154463 type:complete len:243 (+) Transcript_53567:755-1483(+)